MNSCELKEYSWERGRFLSPPPLMLAFLREIKSKVTNQLTWMNMRIWLLFPSKLVDHNKKVPPKNFYWSPNELLAIIFLIMYIKMNCWCVNANHFGHKISLGRPFFFFLVFLLKFLHFVGRKMVNKVPSNKLPKF